MSGSASSVVDHGFQRQVLSGAVEPISPTCQLRCLPACYLRDSRFGSAMRLRTLQTKLASPGTDTLYGAVLGSGTDIKTGATTQPYQASST
eukprot:553345-Rhodomonas_salina.2